MKIFNRTTIKLSVFLSLILFFCQTVSSQKVHCVQGMLFDDILSKFTTRRTTSPEPINKKMIVEIPKQKIGFELNEANEKILRDAGANDSSIKLIRENILPEAIEAISLYEKYLNNYDSGDVEKLKLALEAAKQFVKKFESNGCYDDYVKYYKETIPKLVDAIYSVK